MEKILLKLRIKSDNRYKRFWKTIKPLLSSKYIESSTITLAHNENIFSNYFKLAQTFNNCFERAEGKLRIKECEAYSEVNANSRSMGGINVAIEKYKDHPGIKIIKENVSFESRFNFKEISESDVQKEVFNLNSKKVGTLGNISTAVLKGSTNICNSLLQDI